MTSTPTRACFFSHLCLVVVGRIWLIEAHHTMLQCLSFLDGHAVTGGLHLSDLALQDPQLLDVQLALALVVRVLHLAQGLVYRFRASQPVGGLVGSPVQRDGPIALDGVRGHVQHVANPPNAVEEALCLLQWKEDLVEVGDSALVERLAAP